MLIVCTSSTDVDYATTGDVLGLLFNSTTTAGPGSTQEVDRIGRLVTRASAWADAHVGRPLALQVYSETLAAYGGRQLMVSRRPLVKVLRLFDSSATCDATEYCSTSYRVEDREAGLISRDGGFAWTRVDELSGGDFSLGLAAARLPRREARPWLVEYVAGYSVVGSTTTSFGVSSGAEEYTTGPTLPPDVTQAVTLRAAEMYSNPLGVSQRSVGDLSVTYRGRNTMIGVMSEAEVLLAPYRSAG